MYVDWEFLNDIVLALCYQLYLIGYTGLHFYSKKDMAVFVILSAAFVTSGVSVVLHFFMRSHFFRMPTTVIASEFVVTMVFVICSSDLLKILYNVFLKYV